MKICYIACALDCKMDFTPQEGDLIVGADRGYFTLVKNGISPHVAIGDFDSFTGKVECENTIVFPVKKDFTDSALAIQYAIEQGFTKIFVFGGIGGDLDHTIANVSLVSRYAQQGIEVAFVDGENVIFAIHNSTALFDGDAQGRVSVFSFADKSFGVSESGLLYTLEDAILESRVPLGVSNEFVGVPSKISVVDGTLLIYTNRKNYENHLTRK